MKSVFLFTSIALAAAAQAAFIPAQCEYLEPLGDVDVKPTELLADTVVLQLSIDEKGAVTDVQVWSSSRNPAIDEAAVAAAKKSRFLPAVQDGVTVVSWTQIYYKLSGYKTIEYISGTAEKNVGTAERAPATADNPPPKK